MTIRSHVPTHQSAIEQGLFGRDPTNPSRLLIFTNLQNTAEARNEGVDVDFRLRFPGTIVGNVTFRDTATYYINAAQPVSWW